MFRTNDCRVNFIFFNFNIIENDKRSYLSFDLLLIEVTLLTHLLHKNRWNLKITQLIKMESLSDVE
jgi:hypothetical protein